ncbi:hypothetical protein Y032_0038g3536 [Ancylostoma ceylanicum]|uniref:PNPLA domain-containing protein n=1 Tax=Ancylostoma ceylanicum TaxID=53326 RepID=A0A016UJ69_9BILA|nr:hypothetical protein Y032_0038g3536 [Ancylostoma ceylanicum]
MVCSFQRVTYSMPVASRTPSQKNLEPLFRMASTGDLDGLVKAYLEQEDLCRRDARGNNILHYAAMNDQRAMARGIVAITVSEKLWTLKNKEGRTPIEVATPRIKKDLMLISRTHLKFADLHTALNNQLVEERMNNPDENYKVLLSFDGGGIKAILEAAILKAIEDELDEPLTNRIHWLAGTSCGGIISVCLGSVEGSTHAQKSFTAFLLILKLPSNRAAKGVTPILPVTRAIRFERMYKGLSIEQCRRIFLSARYQTFCGNTHMFPKHNSRGIEDVLRQALGSKTTMGDLKAQKVLVTAAKIKSAPPQLVLFRSYAPRVTAREYEKYGYMNPERILVWKAARATSAAPVFFESFHGLADGAIFCNNPCITMITDFFRLQKLERHKSIQNDDKIGCIITIGSGVEPLLPLGGIDINLSSSPFALGKDFLNIFGKGKNLITLFMYQCTSSHAVSVGQAREWAHSLGIPYFRFSPRLTRAYDLDSTATDGIFDFWFETEVYLKTQAHQDIVNLCRLLKTMPAAGIQEYKEVD